MIETLLKISIPFTHDTRFSPYSPFVFWSKLTRDILEYGPYYSFWDDTGVNELRVVVGSISVDDVQYVGKNNISDCQGDDNSYFFDIPTQTLYIHFTHGLIPRNTDIEIGCLYGFSFIGTAESIYIDDVKYEPRIASVPNIKTAVDAFEVAKMKFQDLSISLFNGDGALDDFIQNPIPGAEGSIILFDTETSTELEYYTGFITSDKNTVDTLTMKLEDKRKRENATVPNTLFDATTYTDIEEKYVGKIIPEGYGVNIGIPCTPLNGTVTTGNIQFKYATDATVLTAVRVKEDDVWSTVTALNSAPTTGYFELSYADATNASGAVLECVADVTLRSDVTPGDIIADSNNRYNSIAYDASNYNTTEWASEDAKLSDIALYMSKAQEFFKWVEAIENGSNLPVLYTIQGDGRRTLRVNDPNRTSVKSITYGEIKNYLRPVERDFSQFSSTVAVLYSHNWQLDTDSRIDITDYEAAVIEKYGYPQDSEFESLLVSSTTATEKAEVIAEDQSEARAVATVVIHEDVIDNLSLKLFDVVSVDLSTPDKRYWAEVPDEIYFDYTATDEIYFDYSATDDVFFSYGEFVVSETGRTYWGSIRGQILGIGYNPSNLEYTLTIRERPESEVI